MISIKGLKHYYTDADGKEVKALDGIDLDIKKGEFVAIIGANGSGKSTLARHLNALLLPTIMEFNMPAALDKYVQIAKAMGVYYSSMTTEQAAQAAVDAVKQLSVNVGIPQHLTDLGIAEADLPRLSEAAFADVCTPGNPREVSVEEILELYKKVL